jgi:RNA polymerase sigma-70 factor (ECF subfamily)
MHDDCVVAWRALGLGLADQRQESGSRQDIERALRVRQGDHAAFRSLYEDYGGSVFGLAQSVVHDRSVAEDITHDVFLGFWRNPHAFEPSRGQFAAWLLRVTRNRSIDVLRRRRDIAFGGMRTTTTGEPTDPTQWIIDEEPGPDVQAEGRAIAEDVRAALRMLPPDHRQLLELAYFRGLTQREIAEHVNRPLGTVKTQIRTSLMKLARMPAVQSLATSREPAQLVNEEGESAGDWNLSSFRSASLSNPENP